ncbi:hypothetical protein ISN45_At02g010450 [Arabidopsis thaliana x Arabidopsis arenosa]|uniref:Uncharacterized protein n=2 Tax=Arabidopsis TaxID=3701 RepID=A0A8T2FXF1_ARASU|nr:hypothetical protein ISN45_At02g010450 [Arabidopsis thaliana x Arabidopsis arenosa]KAG7641032.1 hypothetical protein ISN44_As02g010930 [Arabidopsis suecica]
MREDGRSETRPWTIREMEDWSLSKDMMTLEKKPQPRVSPAQDTLHNMVFKQLTSSRDLFVLTP